MNKATELKAVSDAIDIFAGYDDTYGNLCPLCGETDVPHNSIVGFGIEGKGRLCRECLESKSQTLASAQEWIQEADFVIRDAQDPELARLFVGILGRFMAEALDNLEPGSNEDKWLRGDVTYTPATKETA